MKRLSPYSFMKQSDKFGWQQIAERKSDDGLQRVVTVKTKQGRLIDVQVYNTAMDPYPR